jgi:transcriptional regulator with XRE-family HTH domain
MTQTARSDERARLTRALTTARKSRGLSQQALATAAGVSVAVVSKLEQGRWTRSPDAITLGKIGEALGMTVDDLLSDAERSTDARPSPAKRRGDWITAAKGKRLTISIPHAEQLVEAGALEGRRIRIEGRVKEEDRRDVARSGHLIVIVERAEIELGQGP